MAALLAERLIARGWPWNTLQPLFRDAFYGRKAAKTKLKNTNDALDNNDLRPMFLNKFFGFGINFDIDLTVQFGKLTCIFFDHKSI